MSVGFGKTCRYTIKLATDYGLASLSCTIRSSSFCPLSLISSGIRCGLFKYTYARKSLSTSMDTEVALQMEAITRVPRALKVKKKSRSLASFDFNNAAGWR